jgi:hypothetical protein
MDEAYLLRLTLPPGFPFVKHTARPRAQRLVGIVSGSLFPMVGLSFRIDCLGISAQAFRATRVSLYFGFFAILLFMMVPTPESLQRVVEINEGYSVAVWFITKVTNGSARLITHKVHSEIAHLAGTVYILHRRALI